MLAVAWDEPQPFATIHDLVCTLEIYGLGGFGWGVSWISDDGKVAVERGLKRYIDEAEHRELIETRSTRYLVHLRRPNKLSTVQYADTQPFSRAGEFAFCHNGFLDRAEALRPNYEDRLEGGADSEVGWCFFQDLLDHGTPATQALREVDETFRGKVNLGYVDRTGTLAVYAGNVANAMWRFNHLGADMVATALHSDDDSLFTLVFPDADDRRLVPVGHAVVVGQDE
jgi:predicted glutamine amidotransferase